MHRRMTSKTQRSAPKLSVAGIASLFAVCAPFALSGAHANERHAPKNAKPRMRWSSRTARLFQIFVVVIRFVVATTAIQITGIPHVAADVISTIQGEDDSHREECPNDDGGRECPPGCPSCHCAHVMNALPFVAPPTELHLLPPMDIVIVPYIKLEPPGPEPAALYRPPRTAIFV